MRDVMVGYGDFKDYKLIEVPDSFLTELSQRFPLKSDKHEESDWKELFITVAVHEEVERRRSGGIPQKRRPNKRQLAEEIVMRGFHHLSKTHHPDRNGDNETQKLLTSARDFLQRECKGIEEDYDENTVLIKAPFVSAEITDEDIPF